MLCRGSDVVSSTRTGRRSRAVPLHQDDPRVIAAQQAERRLYGYYGLEPAHHPVALPRLGLRVRLTEVGSGPPVLVVPGNTGDGFPFAPLIPHLPGRRVIVLNRPGGGLSEGSPRSCSTAGSRSSPEVATCRGSTTRRRPGAWSWTSSAAPSTSEGHAVSTTPEPADHRGERPETEGSLTR